MKSRSGLTVAGLKGPSTKIYKNNDELWRFVEAEVSFVQNVVAYTHGVPKGLRYDEGFPVKVVEDNSEGRIASLVHGKAARCDGAGEL